MTEREDPMTERQQSRLWIMRHGEAASAETDARRPLSDRGQAEVSRMARWFCETCLSQNASQERGDLRILASPYLRAQQTAGRMAKPLGVEIETLEIVTPEDDVESVIDWLMAQPMQDMLLVSHMPLVSKLAGHLVEGNRQAGMSFSTASIAALEAEVWAAGCAYLKGFHTLDTTP